jgi:hypothetical protein
MMSAFGVGFWGTGGFCWARKDKGRRWSRWRWERDLVRVRAV